MTAAELGETGPKPPRRNEGVRDAGFRPGRQRDDEETNVGCRGGCGARPCGDRRVFIWNGSSSQKAAAQAPRGDQRVGAGRRRQGGQETVPVRLEALGTVTTDRQRRDQAAASTARSSAVQFEDGARVKQGDLLFVLDSRSIEARDQAGRRQSSPATEAQLERRRARRAALHRTGREERDHRSSTLDNAQDPGQRLRARSPSPTRRRSKNLKVQLSYCTIRAPISGRISMASVKVGNYRAPGRPRRRSRPSTRSRRSTCPSRCRSAACRTCATALAAETATLEAIVPGDRRARDRPGHDDREHGRSGDRHGDGPRHHAERGRSAVAGHAGQHRS